METQMIQHISAGDTQALKDAYVSYYPVLYRQAWDLGFPDPAQQVNEVFLALWEGKSHVEGSLLETLTQASEQAASDISEPATISARQRLSQQLQTLSDASKSLLAKYYFEFEKALKEASHPWDSLGVALWQLTGLSEPSPEKVGLMAKYHHEQTDEAEGAMLRHWVDDSPQNLAAFEAVYEVHVGLSQLPEAVDPTTAWLALAAALPQSPSQEAPEKKVRRFSLKLALWLFSLLIFVYVLAKIGLSA